MTLKQNGNKILLMLSAVFITGYVIFFTSTLWIGRAGSFVEPTKLFNAVAGGNREATICRWNYSHKQRIMEIELEILNKDVISKSNKYAFSASDRNKGKIPLNVVCQKDEYFVLRLENVSAEWSEISLKVCEESNHAHTYVKLYTNKENINTVDWIEDLDEYKHLIRHQDDYINYYTALIDEENENIKDHTKGIEENSGLISKLEADKAYQTEKEKESTNQRITSLQSNTDTLHDKINTSNNNIYEYIQRIEMANKKKDALKEEENNR